MGFTPTGDDRYRAALEYLYGRLDYERSGMPRSASELRLGRMRRLLKALDDPQDALGIVHVAGTKGKGSTSAMLASVLSASGRTTGLFTSPHLHRLEERFRVDGVDAEPDDLVRLIDIVRPHVERLDHDDPHFADREATFFEMTTAMGLIHFARRRASFVVLEVGLGGRLDSTNAVRPLLSVLTSISFDHQRLLGSTLGAIAGEKAGIVKRGRPVVSGVEGDEAASVIRSIAATRRAPMREVGVDFRHVFHPPTPPVVEPCAGTFETRTWLTNWGSFPVPLIGPHQAANAAVVLATLDVLAERGIEVPRSAVERGFASVVWPARAEVLGRNPWIVVDGAHNVASAEALASTLRGNFPNVPRTLIFGTTREKDLEGQLRALLPEFDVLIATRYRENPRALPIDELVAAVPEDSPTRLEIADDPAEALGKARALTPRDGLICITGSLFLAGETRALLIDHDGRSGSAKPNLSKSTT